MACLGACLWPLLLPSLPSLSLPLVGGFWFLSNYSFVIAADRRDDDYYAHEGWERVYHSPVLSAHTSFYSQVKAFMSAWAAAILNSCGMFSIAMQWISHCVQGQIDSVGVFVWALAPFVVVFCFCCLLRCLRWRNASLAGGFAGRRFRLVVAFVFVASIDLPFPRTFCPCLCIPCLLSCKNRASARHRPHSRKKNLFMIGNRSGEPSMHVLRRALHHYVTRLPTRFFCMKVQNCTLSRLNPAPWRSDLSPPISFSGAFQCRNT